MSEEAVTENDPEEPETKMIGENKMAESTIKFQFIGQPAETTLKSLVS